MGNKIFLVFISLFIVSTGLFGQSLNLANFLLLREQNLEYIDNYLNGKGFTISATEKPNKNGEASVNWNKIGFDKVESFYILTKGTKLILLVYTTSIFQEFETWKYQAKIKGYNSLNSEITNSGLSSTYFDPKSRNTIIFLSEKNEYNAKFKTLYRVTMAVD